MVIETAIRYSPGISVGLKDGHLAASQDQTSGEALSSDLKDVAQPRALLNKLQTQNVF